MKLKGLSKIAIAGAALAATAATLATSTYAWYVSNDNVSMSGVSGATAGTEVGANLVIAGNLVKAGTGDATTDAPSSWGPSVTLSEASDRTAYNTPTTSNSKFLAESLNPQSNEATSGTLTNTWKDADGATLTSTSFIEFKVWIKNSKAAVITPEFGISNTTTTLKTQTAYNPNGLPSGVSADDTFTADAVNALRMEITKESTTTYSTPTKEIFKVAEMAKLGGQYTTDTSKFVTGGDANEYYKHMKNKTAYNTTGFDASNRAAGSGLSLASVYTGEKSAWDTFTVAADEAVKLTFRIWLEGADSDCWDSCIAQTFEFSLKFTAADAPANNDGD